MKTQTSTATVPF